MVTVKPPCAEPITPNLELSDERLEMEILKVCHGCAFSSVGSLLDYLRKCGYILTPESRKEIINTLLDLLMKGNVRIVFAWAEISGIQIRFF